MKLLSGLIFTLALLTNASYAAEINGVSVPSSVMQGKKLTLIGAGTRVKWFFDVYVMFSFGILGLAMRWLEMPIIPLLLAMVLGRQLEEHLRVSLIASKNDVSIFFTSPFSLFFLCLAAGSIIWSLRAEYKRRQSLTHPTAL